MHRRIMALTFVSVLAGASAFSGGQPSTAIAANPSPISDSSLSGTLSLTGDSLAFLVGYTWGNGTLSYQGAQHNFKITGLSALDIGATELTATGQVYNLKRIEDFNGIYTAVSAGATAVDGGTVTYLRNNNGVYIELKATTRGADFQLGADGVQLALN